MVLEYIADAVKAAADSNAQSESEEIKNDYYNDFHFAIGHTQGCLSELCNSLNYEYEPAPTLRRLYRYCFRKLAESEAKADTSPLDEVVKVIKPLRDAYDKISSENTGGPVMGNSQEVYAGLTYGRSTLNESYAENSNRGFFA